jgi:hypothetical protein
MSRLFEDQNPTNPVGMRLSYSIPKTRALSQLQPYIPPPSVSTSTYSPCSFNSISFLDLPSHLASTSSMVASSNHEQYTPFPRVTPFEPEGFQSSASEAESEILSPVFDQPRTAFLPMDCAFTSRSPSEPSQFPSSLLHKGRYQSIASDCLLPHDGLIAPPHSSQHYVQSQGFGAHHHGYPKEPPNTAISYNASVQLRTQSFTSSAYELAMANCSPLLMNSATNRFSTSVDIPPSIPHTTPSHFHLSHPPTIASVPLPQPPLGSPVDAVDPPTSATPVASTDLSITSSSRAGPPRSLSSGVIACQQWYVVICLVHKKSRSCTYP